MRVGWDGQTGEMVCKRENGKIGEIVRVEGIVRQGELFLGIVLYLLVL